MLSIFIGKLSRRLYMYHYVRIEISSVLERTIYLVYTLLPSILYSESYLSILSLIPVRRVETP